MGWPHLLAHLPTISAAPRLNRRYRIRTYYESASGRQLQRRDLRHCRGEAVHSNLASAKPDFLRHISDHDSPVAVLIEGEIEMHGG